MNIHLSDDQLVDRLYGVADEGNAHLDACPECQVRWSRIQQRRDLTVVPVSLTSQQARQQRRQILNRISSPVAPLRLMWVPATAAAMLFAGFVLTSPTANAPVPQDRDNTEIVEAGWFDDAYSAMRVMEPRAATPIRELFSEGVAE